jgi:hypothetical protein
LNEGLLTIMFWHSYEFLQTFDSCEFLVWDDELHEVNAANGGGQSAATMQLGAEFGKAFGQEFGKAYGEEFGKGLQEFGKAYGQEFGKAYGVEFGKAFGQEIGKEIGNKLGQFVWVAIMMCGILVAMLFKSM